MTETQNDLMREATRLTRSGNLVEATALLQQWLGGQTGTVVEQPSATTPIADVLDGCVFDTDLPREPVQAHAAPSRGEFISGVHTHAALTRHYKLYIPPNITAGEALPLVVMLHGCTQNPDDFAAGTGMNERALQQKFFVLYPAQSQDANPSRCWNWFKHNHQQRDRGEPALIASLTRAVLQSQPIDPARVYVAGLSAGGAMAAIVAAAYPDIYAAVGVHSGLAPGAATNMGEALSAMNGSGAGASIPLGIRPNTVSRKGPALNVPTIVFHGDRDKTVNPVNGTQVMDARLASHGAHSTAPKLEQGSSVKGRRFTKKVYQDERGHVLGEHWLVQGAGHAWFGGHAAGSYTDALGPDATGEMLRFFFEHPKRKS